jgi:hypothetical protein
MTRRESVAGLDAGIPRWELHSNKIVGLKQPAGNADGAVHQRRVLHSSVQDPVAQRAGTSDNPSLIRDESESCGSTGSTL